MESNRSVFLRMSEECYLDIPQDVREHYLTQKRVDEEKGDWAENMKDVYYSELYKKYKVLKKELAEREYQLRENRRKLTNK